MNPNNEAHQGATDDEMERVDEIVRSGPAGAIAVAGIATALTLWLLETRGRSSQPAGGKLKSLVFLPLLLPRPKAPLPPAGGKEAGRILPHLSSTRLQVAIYRPGWS